MLSGSPLGRLCPWASPPPLCLPTEEGPARDSTSEPYPPVLASRLNLGGLNCLRCRELSPLGAGKHLVTVPLTEPSLSSAQGVLSNCWGGRHGDSERGQITSPRPWSWRCRKELPERQAQSPARGHQDGQRGARALPQERRRSFKVTVHGCSAGALPRAGDGLRPGWRGLGGAVRGTRGATSPSAPQPRPPSSPRCRRGNKLRV